MRISRCIRQLPGRGSRRHTPATPQGGAIRSFTYLLSVGRDAVVLHQHQQALLGLRRRLACGDLSGAVVNGAVQHLKG